MISDTVRVRVLVLGLFPSKQNAGAVKSKLSSVTLIDTRVDWHLSIKPFI